MPDGADAIVIQEDTNAVEGRVEIYEAPKPGAWVRRRGSDLAHHQTMLARGNRIGAGEIGILAAQGISSVTVFREPRVAILSTGDELRDIDEPSVPGSIVDRKSTRLN